MAFNKKPLQDGVKTKLKDYSVDLEDRVEDGFNDVENKIKITTNRFYERTYTTNSGGNVDTTFPQGDNRVVIYDLMSVNVSTSEQYKYSLTHYWVSGTLRFRLLDQGVSAPNMKFVVRFIAVEVINVD